jgi:hypothetical protein
MVGDEWWGVVNTYDLRLNATIGNDEEVRAILRRGDLVRIGQIRSHYDATTSQWASYYFVSNINGSGWVKEDYINIYNYQQMAFDAQKQMTID